MFGLNMGDGQTQSDQHSVTSQSGSQSGMTTFNPYANQTLASLSNAYGNSGQAFMQALSGLGGMASADTSKPSGDLLAALQSSAAIGQPQFQENLAAVRGRGYGGGNALDLKMQNQMLQDYQNQRQASLDQMVLQDNQQRNANKLQASQALGSLSSLGNDFLKALSNQTQQYSQQGTSNQWGTENSNAFGMGFNL